MSVVGGPPTPTSICMFFDLNSRHVNLDERVIGYCPRFDTPDRDGDRNTILMCINTL